MKDRFFAKLDWAAFWCASLLVFIVYLFTLGPSVGLEDSGELATAAAHLGVPHPPGYPFWTLCSWVFCKLFFFVTYMGYPNPAWCVSLCSAFFGALAAGFTAMLICRSGRDFVSNDVVSFAGGVAGAFTFALSPVEWSQSTIVEVYSLNAFFLMWVFLLSYRWMRKPSDKILFLTAFVFGLGLTNYQVLLFAIVPLGLIILMKNIQLFRDVFIYLIPVGLVYQILKIGSLLRASADMSCDVINKHLPVLETRSCPSSFFILLGVALVVSAIIYAKLSEAESKQKLKTAMVLGFSGAGAILASATVFSSPCKWTGVAANIAPLIEPSKYALIAAFVAASISASVVSILKTERFERNLWLAISAILGAVSVFIAFGVPSAGDAQYLGPKFPWGKSTAVFVSFIALLFALCATIRNGLAFAVPVAALHAACFILLSRGAMNGLTHPQSWWFCWPICWNAILLSLAYLALPNGRSVAGAAFFAQLGVSFYAYMPIVSELRNPPMNWGYPRTWEGFKHAIMRGQYEAITLPDFKGVADFFLFLKTKMLVYAQDVRVQFTDLFILFSPVPFFAGHWVVRKDLRKTFWQWMLAAFACFLMMSGLLLLLANVRGDIQDGFIQKVKFISSHAMLALWIGYGLVFTLAVISRHLRSRTALWIVSSMAVTTAFVYPIVQNYTDDRLVFELGGSEQNDHTFGWQFGAYQLEGYKAINEQLQADEEPLPDPSYPPPMDRSAVFFGGTDPGRFVPTYMIYCANFRPDIYIITQNALADDTYMSVERDLYGDEIWIPAKEDCGEAFNIYADEVRRGVRQANGEVSFQNGRMQVTGALGVMEINSILARMMFEHEKDNRSFYVEESYPIEWMYPYLSPHGLIMKINKAPGAIPSGRYDQDADFWDWYLRRLLDDPMYRRDFAAQKSFSKLRSAIAGLYAKKGETRRAAQAYREACLLYPISPEAVFKYSQDVLLKEGKWDAVLDLMDFSDRLDPNNRRTAPMRAFIKKTKTAQETIANLEPIYKNGKLNASMKHVLATTYCSVGRVFEGAVLLREVANKLRSAEDLALAWQIFMTAGFNHDAESVIKRFISSDPRSVQAWVDLSRVQHRLGKRIDAEASFIQAYRLDAQNVFTLLKTDEELFKIASPLFQKRN